MSRFRFFTGSYTEEDLFPGSKGKGIQLWELDSESGCLEHISTFGGISNPSWLSADRSGRYLAAASEHVGAASKIALLRIHADGTLEILDTIRAGDATCHVAFSPDSRLLAAAAYVAGEVRLMPVHASGFSGRDRRFAYSGSGPDTVRQETPHAHQVVFSPDGRFLYVTDLGSDRIWLHRIENAVMGPPEFSLSLPPGTGPRHLVLDWKGSLACILAELTGEVHIASVNPESGELAWLDSISSLPGEWAETPASAAIRMHPHLPCIYVSNRNGGLLSAFKIDPVRKRLELTGILPLKEPSPRDFQISPDGRWLLIAGQETHRLLVHPIHVHSGEVGPVHLENECPSAVCIEWLTGKR